MNTPKLFGLVLIGMLAAAGSAAAVGATVGSYAQAQADASAHYEVNYQPALDAAAEAKAQAEAKARATVDTTTSAALEAKAKGEATARAGAETSAEAKTNAMSGLRSNVEAAITWAKSIWVKPHADLESTSAANALADGAITHEPGRIVADGNAHADLVSDTTSSVGVDYGYDEPPQPKLDFFASIKASLSAFLGLSG